MRNLFTILPAWLVVIAAGAAYLPSAQVAHAQGNTSYRQEADPRSEGLQWTQQDQDMSDFDQNALDKMLAWPYETLDPAYVGTGILCDRTELLTPIEGYQGQPAPDTAALSTWKQIYHELDMAEVGTPGMMGPSVDAIEQQAEPVLESGVVPIAILNLKYDKVKDTAVDDGLLEERDGQLYDVPGRPASPYVERLAFTASPFVETLYDRDVTFKLDDAFYFSNRAAQPTLLEVDLGDGAGYRNASWGALLTTTYGSDGVKVGRLRAHFPGEVLESTFSFEVQALSMPQPDFCWNKPSRGTYLGEPAGYTACAFYAEGHSSLEKPLIFVEGFDREDKMDVEFLYARLDSVDVPSALSDMGYDLIILDFDDAITYIQRNSEALITLIEDVNAAKTTREPNVVAGASMGGLVTRYALAKMERENRQHEANVYVTFDSPHRGANIPLGLQYALFFFSVVSDGAEDIIDQIDSPAARQMLVYHYRVSNSEFPKEHPLRLQWRSDLFDVGNYPGHFRLWKVAIANGSGHARAQRDEDGNPMTSGSAAQLLRFRAPLGLVQADAWAVPDGGIRTKIFDGRDLKPFSSYFDLERYVDTPTPPTEPYSRPYDNAPGGHRASAQEIVDIASSRGNASTDYPRHAFVPTISALNVRYGVNSVIDLFYDVAQDPTLPNMIPLAQPNRTPFDILRYPFENEEHVDLAGARSFLLEQIGYVPEQLRLEDLAISTAEPILRGRSEVVIKDVELTPGADVILASGGTVRLGPGFRAEKGSKLSVYVDPALSQPPPVARYAPASSGEPVAVEEGIAQAALEVAATLASQGEVSQPATEALPEAFELSQNYPNPFNPTTQIRFALPEATEVLLTVYDVMGREVARLAEGRMEAGVHRVSFGGSYLPSGMYLYRLRAGAFSEVRRMLLVK